MLVTTRNHQAAARIRSRGDIIKLEELGNTEAAQLLHQGLEPDQIDADGSTAQLLEYLANLPLAIRQASAYMAANTDVTASRYLGYCRSGNQTMVKLLSRDFEDQDRYEAIRNPVATTWLISFEHIRRDMPLAAEYLRFVCYLAERDIPGALVRRGEDELAAEAMGSWLEEQGEEAEITRTIRKLCEAFPKPKHENRELWTGYLAHAQAALEVHRTGAWTKKLCTVS